MKAEIIKREKALYECALMVENDPALKADLTAWDITIDDGLKDETSNEEMDLLDDCLRKILGL